MKTRGLEWLQNEENTDYFAEDILRLKGQEQHQLMDGARVSYDLLVKTVERAIAENRWRELGIPEAARHLVKWSFENELADYLVGRFDFAGGLDGVPIKLLEFNADTCSLMPETADVQRHIWENSKPKRGNGPEDGLSAALTAQFEHIIGRNNHLNPNLLLSAMGYEEDWLNVETISQAAEKAGFDEVQLLDYDAIIFDPENGLFLELGEDEFLQFDYWYKMIPWDFLVFEDPEIFQILQELVLSRKLKILNPAWTMALQSKGILVLLAEYFLDESIVLKASYDQADFPIGNYAQKPIFGRTGENVRLYDDEGKLFAENEGDFEDQEFIVQRLAEFAADEEECLYQASVFYVQQPVAIAIRRQDNDIIDDDAQYVAHTIDQ